MANQAHVPLQVPVRSALWYGAPDVWSVSCFVIVPNNVEHRTCQFIGGMTPGCFVNTGGQLEALGRMQGSFIKDPVRKDTILMCEKQMV